MGLYTSIYVLTGIKMPVQYGSYSTKKLSCACSGNPYHKGTASYCSTCGEKLKSSDASEAYIMKAEEFLSSIEEDEFYEIELEGTLYLCSIEEELEKNQLHIIKEDDAKYYIREFKRRYSNVIAEANEYMKGKGLPNVEVQHFVFYDHS